MNIKTLVGILAAAALTVFGHWVPALASNPACGGIGTTKCGEAAGKGMNDCMSSCSERCSARQAAKRGGG